MSDLLRLAAKTAGYDPDCIAVLRRGQVPTDRKFKVCEDLDPKQFFNNADGLVIIEWEVPPPPPKPPKPAPKVEPAPSARSQYRSRTKE